MQLEPKPLTVECNSCHKTAETFDGEHPDRAVECDCCPVKHDHAGLGCRTVTITAFAYLTIFDVNDLLDALAEEAAEAEWDSRFDQLTDGNSR